MKKMVFILSFVGITVLSISVINDRQSVEIFAQNGQTAVKDEDQYLFISAEEQNMVENSSALSGFIPQKNGTGFFFEKTK
ncbi:hypothetical protein [Metabacillus fastidiosus]|uniref:hypothetical protein n=1 Tax=Metabacillus fastidiosus TaxID=1458 RepID=UPI003D2C2530